VAGERVGEAGGAQAHPHRRVAPGGGLELHQGSLGGLDPVAGEREGGGPTRQDLQMVDSP
jgi:hypothetical protein